MNTRMAHWISASVAAIALGLGACGGDGGERRDDEADAADDEDSGIDASGGGRTRDRDAQLAAADANGEGGAAGSDAATQGDSGAGMDSGPSNTQGDAGAGADGGGSTSGDAGPAGEGGAPNQGGDCAAKAKDECEYQKKCDPVHFGLQWDEDINQFCIPKRKAACEKGQVLPEYRAISEACNTWVRASCDNYRNFYHPVLDSNGKWQYGDPACEVTSRIQREDRALNADCTWDYHCKDGLFCRTAADDYLSHGDPKVESICGKCATQYAYDGPNTSAGFGDDQNVCYRQTQCKAGYQCLLVYGTENDEFKTFDVWGGVDLGHCVKTVTKVGRDKPCAKGSNVVCDDGLVCKGDSEAAIKGTCVPAEKATIPTYVGKDAACNPALCDPRLHLECKPVKAASGATETRCVQTPVAAIGGFCKNDKKEDVATCSQYARCVENTGMCVRRNVENESCFPTSATPSQYDPGSCDPSVYAEKLLVCRQDNGELAPKCHQALPQNMCSLPR